MTVIYFIIILFLFYYLPKFGYRLAARRSQPLPEPGADEARRAADTLAGRHDAARPGVALAAGSAGRDRPAGRRGPDGAGTTALKFAIVPSRRAPARLGDSFILGVQELYSSRRRDKSVKALP